ncbi:MAG: HK97 gp10 family phage protein [Oscillospiraceae bacterium]|jgi:hypothetical protein|nr:HK97 gp10 family phage protein [Oscillospiraceae bacterium]
MAFGDEIRARMSVLRQRGVRIPEVIEKVHTAATMRAIETAIEYTPPDEKVSEGTNTTTGEMQSHWAQDSDAVPRKTGAEYTTVLANSVDYASYVNDGHRMDKHFVPGLVLNPYSGLLEKVDPDMGGIMVGTKTKYVPGVHAKEYATLVWENEVERTLDIEIKAVMGD